MIAAAAVELALSVTKQADILARVESGKTLSENLNADTFIGAEYPFEDIPITGLKINHK